MLVGDARKIASDSSEFWEATKSRSRQVVAFSFLKQSISLDSGVASGWI